MERILAVWASVLSLTLAEINPFSDTIPFDISWPGPILDQESLASHTVISMQTVHREKYQCLLPMNYNDRVESIEDALKKYYGPSETEILRPLFKQKSCSYRLETYWSYELCHGKHLRQYHERKEANKPVVLTEYFLGIAPVSPIADPATEQPATSSEDQTQHTEQQTPERSTEPEQRRDTRKRVDGVDLAYYEFNMTDGTPCDLTNKRRRTSLHYICQLDGNGEIYELKETSTCEYEVTILTAHLCRHPRYRPKDTPVTTINCHSVDGAPPRPRGLQSMDREGEEMREQRHKRRKPEYVVKPKEGFEGKVKAKTPEPAKVISRQTDLQMLRNLLSGDHCLEGGLGWWKYEFCFGKFARQYHEFPDKTRTNILLGKWNEEKHLQFIKKNPNRKHTAEQKTLHLYYTDGDKCDLTGENRNVEVRLRCSQSLEHPHAVSLYLLEPSVCQYVLGVESPILCDVIEKADVNGLVHKKDIP